MIAVCMQCVLLLLGATNLYVQIRLLRLRLHACSAPLSYRCSSGQSRREYVVGFSGVERSAESMLKPLVKKFADVDAELPTKVNEASARQVAARGESRRDKLSACQD